MTCSLNLVQDAFYLFYSHKSNTRIKQLVADIDLQPEEDHGVALHKWKNALNLKCGIHLSFERVDFKQHYENSKKFL